MRGALPIPPMVRRLWSGRLPALWIALGAAVAFWLLAGERFVRVSDVRAEIAPKRDLLERQLALAAQEPAEEAALSEAAAWWEGTGALRVRGGTMEVASARAVEAVSRLLSGEGVTVIGIERTRDDALSEDPRASVLQLTVRVEADRMAPLAEAMARLEAVDPLWVRLGNATIQPRGGRVVDGVRAVFPVYVMISAEGEA